MAGQHVAGDGEEMSWDRVARSSSVGQRAHARIRAEAERLCRELEVPWADRWCDDAVAFMERRAVDVFASPATAEDDPRYLRFVCYAGEGAVRRGAGWWVDLPGERRAARRLAVYVPAENSLAPANALVNLAIEYRTGRLWLDRYAVIGASRGRVLSGTGIRDARVVAFNTAVEAHLVAAVAEVGSTDGAHRQARHARDFLAMHQPLGGNHGAECLGCRGGSESGAVWPCETVERLLITQITARPPMRCGHGRPHPGFRGRPGRDER